MQEMSFQKKCICFIAHRKVKCALTCFLDIYRPQRNRYLLMMHRGLITLLGMLARSVILRQYFQFSPPPIHLYITQVCFLSFPFCNHFHAYTITVFLPFILQPSFPQHDTFTVITTLSSFSQTHPPLKEASTIACIKLKIRLLQTCVLPSYIRVGL